MNATVVLAWLFLVGASLATFELVENRSLAAGWAVCLVMAIAALKGRTIVLHYMELKHAPLAWRIAFGSWVAIAASVILGLWFFAGTAPDCSPP